MRSGGSPVIEGSGNVEREPQRAGSQGENKHRQPEPEVTNLRVNPETHRAIVQQQAVPPHKPRPEAMPRAATDPVQLNRDG